MSNDRAASDDWFTRLGFATDPFGQAPGVEFHFTTPSLQQRLDLVLHLIEFSSSPIAILGDEGSGKSALLRAVARLAPPQWRYFLIVDSARTTESSLAHTIADALAMRLPKDAPELELRLVCDRLRAMAGSGAIIVGLIDDARAMPADLLRQLLEMAVAAGDESALRLVLALRGREAEPLSLPLPEGMDVGTIRRIALPVFSAEQIEAYLAARFEAAGSVGASPLPAAALDWVRLQAAGNPGRAELLARRALQSPESVPSGPWFDPDRLRGIARTVPRAAWVAGGGFAALALAVMFWLSSRPDADREAVERIVEGSVRTRTFQLELPNTEIPAAAVTDAGQAAPAQPVPPPNNSVAAPLPMLREQQSQAAEFPEPAQTKAPAPQRLAPEEARQQSPAADPVVPRATAAGKDADWLFAQPGNGYAIQLLAAFDRAALRRYLRQHGLEQQAIIIEGSRDGRAWFIATLGYFPTRNAANAAIVQLPAAVQRERPWPRTIKELRAATQP